MPHRAQCIRHRAVRARDSARARARDRARARARARGHGQGPESMALGDPHCGDQPFEPGTGSCGTGSSSAP